MPEEAHPNVQYQNIMEDTSPNRASFMDRVIRPCLAEFVGETLFVFAGSMSVQDGELTAIAFCHGLMIAVLVASFGHISGAHLNPVVTLAVLLCGEITPLLGGAYMLVQLTAGVVGAACCRGVLRNELLPSDIPGKNITYWTLQAGGQTLAPGVTVGEGIMCEMLLTSILITVVLMTAVDKESKSKFAPLMIGLCVTACILAGAKTSGASMNPARSFGPALVYTYHDSTALWQYHYVYWLGPTMGSILAVILYRFLFAAPDKRLPGRTPRPF